MKLKPWWDTRRCRNWPLEGPVIAMLGRRIVYTFDDCPVRPANDSWTGN